jgi:PPOX class probable F420-dependent enzyme
MLQIDTSTEFGARVARRLAEEELIWLTTTAKDGTPQPSLVWFLWETGTLLIFSRPDTPKLRNIARNPRVALNFNSAADGGDMIVMTGSATTLESPAAASVATYLQKYARGIAALGSEPDTFLQEYRQAIRVVPDRLRGF